MSREPNLKTENKQWNRLMIQVNLEAQKIHLKKIKELQREIKEYEGEGFSNKV